MTTAHWIFDFALGAAALMAWRILRRPRVEEESPVAAMCLRCPWRTSGLSVPGTVAALTEHVRQRHGGIP